jgi:hemolysin-activating ACP:hemolysin acyltransferase
MLAATGTLAGRPAERPAGQNRLQLRQFDNPATALGTAVSYLMTRPAFARLGFGTWAGVLVGQISRRHYAFVYDLDTVVGYAGWALANADNAEAWINGDAGAPADDGRTGDCLVVSAWAVSTPDAHGLLVEHLRRIGAGKNIVYGKRIYRDRQARPTRLRTGGNAAEPGTSTRLG